MFSRYKCIAAALSLCLFVACAEGVRISSFRDKSFDFSGLSTYGWVAPVEFTDPRLNDKEFQVELRRVASGILNARGYAPAAGGKPDFLMSFDWSITDRTDIVEQERMVGPAGMHEDSSWYDETRSPRLVDYDEGFIWLVASLPGSSQVIWKGRGRTRVEGFRRPEKKQKKRLERVVTQVMRNFPVK